MTLLGNHDQELTAEERQAIADEARPGVWVGEGGSDGRALTQEQTDYLIGYELHQLSRADRNELRLILRMPPPFGDERRHWALPLEHRHAHRQRGGIHSDPLVRLIAFRAWGDRDRRWRKRDTAKALGRGDSTDFERWRIVYGFDGLSMHDQNWERRELYGANRGGIHAEVAVPYSKLIRDNRKCDEILLDVFDELDAKLAAGGDPPSAGPTFYVRG